MALAVENPSVPLDSISRSYGRWNYTDLDNDYPELVDGVRQLLEMDEVKAYSDRHESVKAAGMYTTSRKLADAVQSSPNHNEEPRFNTPGWSSKGNLQFMERTPQLNRSEHNSESLYTARCALPQTREHLQFSESAEDYLHQSKYQSPFVGHRTDNTDFSRIHSTLPSYSSTPKSFLNKPVRRSLTPSPGYSKSYLSGTLTDDCSLREERARSRSLSLARISSSNTVKPLFLDSRADNIEDRFSRTWKSRQRSFSNGMDKKQDWKDSPFQADYWACALPNCKPPCPDRQSPHWNPDKEYQDLLDYTYPLNAKHLRSREKSSDYISPEPLLHDSGIGLGSFSASPEHTIPSLSSSWNDADHSRASDSILSGKFAISPQSYTDLSSSSGYLKTDSNRDLAPAAAVLLEKCSDSTSGTDVSTDFKIPFYNCAHSSSSTPSSVDESEWCVKEDHLTRSKLQSDVGFIHTTDVLQLKKVWDNDDEYLSLPPRLKELENLAQQLTDLSLTVQKSGYDKKERDLLDTVDRSAPLKPKYAQRIDGSEIGSILEDDRNDTPEYRFTVSETQNTNIKKIVQCQGDAEIGLTKLSSLKCMLEGLSSSPNSTTDEWHQCKELITGNRSLVQCIKIFCHKLEDLIQWLYKVADMTEKWVPPKPNVESIQSALQFYLNFKKDVIEHQTVADDVMKMGDTLLKCMASNSPVLKDALTLIEKHSEELERHGEKLYASVLGAMDTITGSGDH